ncbi:lysine N(6)-hydroxylase/L-ornithine N(5)-oxygenase family protein [Amycolatopsis suaedae]|uniref:L-lysine N6-monooxygenase MbtG n=1 Tax=Amycolatopsis suaedae TaxID=2510978 RepID=A0A4Q7J1R3_9PSEU|nr:SidA/IucD/PvdA family monooxygenase [Amycolatopsis suaedae]RZQ61341.1 lysine 6-monooxygenase [Amycolatopsis suaedae]
MSQATLDLAGVGIGPFNLSLAALAAPVEGLTAEFFERRDEFRWHPGLLIEGTTLQVPFLADLVSLVDPTSPLSFLNYLRDRGRLFPFYFAERFHIPRTEYDDYGRWASTRLPSCRFAHEVDEIGWSFPDEAFELTFTGGRRVLARNVVLGVGTAPVIPEALREVVADPDVPAVHSADYLELRDRLIAAPTVTVVGSGQSGAEVFLDLLRARPTTAGLRWVARTPSFAPMEYSKLGLEQFTPDYTDFFFGLSEQTRDWLVPSQWQLYKGIDAETIAAIHDELYRRSIGGGWPKVVMTPGAEVLAARLADGAIALDLHHSQQRATVTVRTDAVVAATGYAETSAHLLDPLAEVLHRDRSGRLTVDRQYRLGLPAEITGSLFVQNAERHTHGVGAPDLGLAAWRSASILNTVCGRTVYDLPDRTAFTTFGLATSSEDE